MSSATVTIDAGVLAVPQAHGSAEDVHGYVERILDWAQLLDEPWIALCMSEYASEALSTDELFPVREHLRLLFSHHGIQEYDINTVAAVINRLLQHTPSFETYYRVRDTLSEDLSTSPDVMQFCTGHGLQTDLARCILLLAILRKHCQGDILQNALILKHCPERTIRVRALVHEIEHERDDQLSDVPIPPEYFEGDVLACDDFRGLLTCIDESAVLTASTDIAGIEIAIRIRLYKSRIERHEEPNWDNIGGMVIGDHFEGAIRQCSRDADPGFPDRALRAVCEAIDKQSLRSIHPLRTSPGGSDPPRRRSSDNAKASRRDIDHEYHLHFWELPNGCIELATVGVHNDFAIPE
ncbi:MAG: hypothetical protein KKB90_01985 [Actinobacteria bacterium]|nr:hypothetical protein [Actinomycetota bacterium]MCG2818782.1 hypothetical protein [Actinomycetes bacterium]MBU4217717.1 hypothetical protein [Actinomycetota bacterium]MBU4358970.1 hypothetical protein [Actinomycetota bacterium]MBU4391689.1 hypothetical protein [Actinomycetota bacterium]